MITLEEHAFPNLGSNLLEVPNHPVARIGHAFQDDLQPIVVPVQARARPVVERKQVGRAEIEVHGKLHSHGEART